jgi:hypothetical protein
MCVPRNSTFKLFTSTRHIKPQAAGQPVRYSNRQRRPGLPQVLEILLFSSNPLFVEIPHSRSVLLRIDQKVAPDGALKQLLERHANGVVGLSRLDLSSYRRQKRHSLEPQF